MKIISLLALSWLALATWAAAESPFRTDDPFDLSLGAEGALLNKAWVIYGVAEGSPEMNGDGLSFMNAPWAEWDTLKYRWLGYHDFRPRMLEQFTNIKVNGINANGVHGDGYIWSWSTTDEAWFDKDGSGPTRHGGTPSWHYDQMPRYIVAIDNAYRWSRDANFFKTMFPRAEFVMEKYLVPVMKGDVGPLTCPAPNDGTAQGRPSNYMDQWRAGHHDAWVNATWFSALCAMSDLEAIAGNREKSERYAQWAERMHAQYDQTFWLEPQGRYAGWRDVSGAAHDAGYVMVNLEALARGLGDEVKARRVFDWLRQPAAPTQGGAHAGSTDVYQNGIAPRSNTAPVPSSDMDGWSDPPEGPLPYGSMVENGSAMAWVNYYDVMARLRYSDADDAWAHLSSALYRYGADSGFYTFRKRGFTDFNEDMIELLANMAENGIFVSSMVDGFIGLEATRDGLTIRPNLPSRLLRARVHRVDFAGTTMTVTVERGRVLDEAPAGDVGEIMCPTYIMAQRFAAREPFNELSLQIRTFGNPSTRFTAELYRQEGTAWRKVAAQRVLCPANDSWYSVAVPELASGVYELRLRDRGGQVGWMRATNGQWGLGATINGNALRGCFALRVINAPRRRILEQTAADGCDRLAPGESLAMSFQAAEPFNSTAIRLGTWGSETAGATLRLERRVAERWVVQAEQNYARVPDNAWLMMNCAPQAAGTYRLVLVDPVGTIGWYRSSRTVMAGGEAEGNGQSVPGARQLRVFRGEYRVQVTPGDKEWTIPMGDSAQLVALPASPKI